MCYRFLFGGGTYPAGSNKFTQVIHGDYGKELVTSLALSYTCNTVYWIREYVVKTLRKIAGNAFGRLNASKTLSLLSATYINKSDASLLTYSVFVCGFLPQQKRRITLEYGNNDMVYSLFTFLFSVLYVRTDIS